MPRGSAGTSGFGSAGLLAALTVWAWLGGWVSPAEAQSAGVYSRRAAGIDLTVDTRWVEGGGYWPVRVTISPTAPTTVDRPFTVEFLVRRLRWSGGGYDLRVARDIELPAGSGPVQATISLPRSPDGDGYAINVLEDGELQPGLSFGWMQIGDTATDWRECLPRMLLVGDAMQETSQLAALLPLEDYFGSQMVRRYYRTQVVPPNVPNQVITTSQELPGVVLCRIAELPQRWIDYSSLDLVCLSLGQLQELAGKNPSAVRAVLEWSAAGGNLWAYGMGQDWKGLRRLEGLLGLPPGAADSSGLGGRGWRQPDNEAYLKAVQGGLSQAPLVERRYPPFVIPSGPDRGEVFGPPPSVTTPPVGKVPSQPHFVFREYDMGLIVALAAEDPFPGTADQWRGVLNTVGPDRWLWDRRHGMSTVRENVDYWNFLIPGVGLVPVTEFCVLITVFVLAIGPLNYWLLRGWGKLYLLVVTIPLGAATVTLALFAYALLADGLGTRVRVRSVTRLDQRRGQAVCWARLSYYAGLAPRRGLTFPDDVVVLPLEYHPLPDYREGPLGRELIWNNGPRGEQQWLASGWLSSRNPMQLLTVRSRPCRLGLELTRSGGSPQGLRVKNDLGTRIEQLVVCCEDGKGYWAEGVEPNQTVALEQFTREARAKLSQTFHQNQPQIPEGLRTRLSGSSAIFGIRYYRPRYGNPGIAPPTQQSSRLEAALAEVRAVAGASLPPPLEPGSYVAVVEKSPEVVLGIASAHEEAGYHVILGKW
jgi:hypothetical protein